jgi:hypothetical protein
MERVKVGAPIYLLAQVSGISSGRLSMAERGFAHLKPDEEQRRKEALKRIASGEMAPA